MPFDPLVDPGNPPHRHQDGPAANTARVHHRMVNMEASAPSRRTSSASEIKNATVMVIGNAWFFHVPPRMAGRYMERRGVSN
jgi:hypothetical protein